MIFLESVDNWILHPNLKDLDIKISKSKKHFHLAFNLVTKWRGIQLLIGGLKLWIINEFEKDKVLPKAVLSSWYKVFHYELFIWATENSTKDAAL